MSTPKINEVLSRIGTQYGEVLVGYDTRQDDWAFLFQRSNFMARIPAKTIRNSTAEAIAELVLTKWAEC